MKKILIDDNWKFKRSEYDEEKLDINFGADKSGYRDVSIPHDALIDDVSLLYKDHVIWYERSLVIGGGLSSDRRFYLYFDGAYTDAAVYVNGECVFEWANGYTSFHFEITDRLKSGDNTIHVRIKYRCPNARWYAGPGINRHVYLLESNRECFEIDSLYVYTTQDEDCWRVHAFIKTGEYVPNSRKVIFTLDGAGREAVLNGDGLYEAEFEYQDPLLWDISDPHLYEIGAKLEGDGQVLDEASDRFGFRSIFADPDEGLFLNGRHIKIKGVCIHSDYGALGSAYDEDVAARQLTMLKDAGVNAIRLAHNDFAPGVYELCDRMGLLVLSEALDCWRKPKTEFDYARFFDEWVDRDIESWITRNRNHPCIFMYSAGNEISDTNDYPDGERILNRIVSKIKEYAFGGTALISLCSNYMMREATLRSIRELDVWGYNYGERLYSDHHKRYPEKCIFGSETASLVCSRSIYHFPYELPILADDDLQCSALGNGRTSWGASSYEVCIATERDTPYSLGQFIWTGIDYIGEPTPYHTKNSYFGLMDTALFPKDSYYLFKAEWNEEASPFVHMLPYWDFNTGETVDVIVYTNTVKVKLFLNGEEVGEKIIDHKNGKELKAHFVLQYVPGVIEAQGYDETGKLVASAVERSFKDVAKLWVSEPEFEVEKEDTHLRFITIKGLDEDGNEVKNGNCRVNVKVYGPAHLVGLDNGNSADNDSYKGNSKRLFGGLLRALVKPAGAGKVSVVATIDDEDIPVRKAELVCERGYKLDAICDSAKITLRLFPQNAYDGGIEYQITNRMGTPVDSAVIENISEDGKSVTVRALEDAIFKLRVICRDKNETVTCISSAQFTAEGIGSHTIDPYGFVYASLYDECGGDVGNGNEKGISTSRTEDSWVLYRNIDFGKKGSDEVILPIFELDGDRTVISIWENAPGSENAVHLTDCVYDKESIWNVYQEGKYSLPGLLRGKHNLAFMTHSHKIHLKGFRFVRHDTAYDRTRAADASYIYGDSYEVLDGSVCGIGNNVTIGFEDVDFAKGISRIAINGRTGLAENPISIILSSPGGKLRGEIMFKRCEEYTEQSFELPEFKGYTGRCDVEFLFLPGSSFDFESFRFYDQETER